MAEEKKEGILSRWFRQRAERKEAEESKPTSQGAGSFGDAKVKAEKAEAEMKALKEKAQKDLEAAQARVEAAKAKIKAQGRTYTVKPGDSLSAIAQQFYGKASKWPKIYEANKDIIGDNPDLIHPGQEFVIPDED
jgi:nucleoid-associated protein YgaU